MKRIALDHPKTNRLASALKIRRWGAVGILESLWHFTARHARRGDIGRWSDAEIATAVDWSLEPSKLIDALVDSGWLDRHPVHRLLVHDWHEHADDSTRKTLRNRKEVFATFPESSGTIPEDSGNGSPKPEARSQSQKPEANKAAGKTKREPKPNSSCWGQWVDAHRARGLPDPTPVGQNTNAAKELARVLPEPIERKAVLEAYLDDPDDWLTSQGHPLAHLPKRIDAYKAVVAGKCRDPNYADVQRVMQDIRKGTGHAGTD